MTVAEMKKAIENLPDDGIILFERIEDVYFEKHNWKPRREKGFQWHQMQELQIKSLPRGEFHNKAEYPNMTEEILKAYAGMDLNEFEEQYIVANCAITYNKKDLYIMGHY